MQNDEGFKLQYSTNHGNSWTDIQHFKFGERGFDSTNKWVYARSETFEVTQGISTTEIRIVGDTNKVGSDSVFYIADVNIYGTTQ